MASNALLPAEGRARTIACALMLALAGCRAQAIARAEPAAVRLPNVETRSEAPVAPVEIAREADASAPAHAVAPEHVAAPPWTVPVDWDTQGLLQFERALDLWFQDAGPRTLDPSTLELLARALDRTDDGSVRAALLLARAGDPAAGEALLLHLEQRMERSDEAGGDGADVVAAAAFTERATARDAAVRIEALATSARPHPDLEVRVECARSALQLGRDGVIPFLLAVLREKTTAALPVADWKRTPDVAWAQMRAADALSRRAGISVAYRPEASIAEREAEAARLGQLLPKPKKKKKK